MCVLWVGHGCCSVTRSYPTLCSPMDYSTPGFPVLHRRPEFAQIDVHWVGDAIQQYRPLSSPSPPAFNLSQHQGSFPNELALSTRWPKYWSFSFIISSSNEYSGLISFRMDWLDLLAVQGFSSLLQQHSLKTSILQCSAFFFVQLSHPYMTAGKTIALTIWTFVGKVKSLLFNTLSSFTTAFLPRSKGLLISWLQSPSAVILQPKKIKSVTVSIVSPSICHEVMGQNAMSFIFRMLSFKPAFSHPSFMNFLKRLFDSSLLFIICHKDAVNCICEVIDISPRNLDSKLCIIQPSMNWLTGKDPDAGKDWRWEEKGTKEVEMVGWHQWCNGHKFE